VLEPPAQLAHPALHPERSALGHARRLLEPGGVLLAMVPATSRERVAVRSYGNVLAGMAFLAGLATEELARRELDRHDPYFPLVVAVRAVKQ
jgi:hypothetical protein